MKNKVLIQQRKVPSSLRIIFFAVTTALSFTNYSFSQVNKIFTAENIGWYNFFGTIQLNKSFGIHSEFQWRRIKTIDACQQNLLRVGINYRPTSHLLIRAGYAQVETFPYGSIPINKYGKPFGEQRLFQMIQLNNKEGILEFTHRFMLEQRFVETFSSAFVSKTDGVKYLNRIRYMFRIQLPINLNSMLSKRAYISGYDELFIGFGKNVITNVFDQNRLGFLLGWKFSERVRMEGGYLQQIIQLGRLVDYQNVFQNNKGLILNILFSTDPLLQKKTLSESK